MPTDLSPAEQDDRETSRLIHKRPPPSRKRKPKRGPKFDNRRRRMLDRSDPDMKANERDRKASLADIALAVAFPSVEATSYGAGGTEDMNPKTAAYHGVVQQGHPSGPTNTGYNSYDKRYFGKPQFDSIVAHAKELLQTDWLKYGWDGGAEDAPIRAALDLAIQLADKNLYQSKIDVETYNMLLARLSKSDVDLFSETLVPEGGKGKRSAAAMDNNLKNMVRVANELRTTNPRAALEIMKNVQAIRVAQVPVESQIQHQSEQQQEQQAQQQQGQMSECSQEEQQAQQQQGQQQQGQQEQGGLTKGPNLKDIKHQVDLFKQCRSPEQVMEVLEKLAESVHTSSTRTASGAMEELAPIADMSDEDLQKFIHMSDRDATKLQDILGGMDESKELSPEDVEALVKGVDDFFNSLVGEAEKLKTASVSVSVASLLRIASVSPEAKMLVMPFLHVAKKKQEKAKKKKKKAPAKKKEAPKKGNPFAKGGPKAPPAKGGKKGPPAKGKAPPFGGKKAPPFGKKASVDIGADDTKW